MQAISVVSYSVICHSSQILACQRTKNRGRETEKREKKREKEIERGKRERERKRERKKEKNVEDRGVELRNSVPAEAMVVEVWQHVPVRQNWRRIRHGDRDEKNKVKGLQYPEVS